MKSGHQVALTPAYVLHQYPFRDTSRIVEVFTRDFGRFSVLARGVQTEKSPWRAVLRPFQRLLLSFSRKSELGVLQSAEADGGVTQLPAARLMSGFYLNELLLKLTEKSDPHAAVFDDYAAALLSLAGVVSEERALRLFEKKFLDALGYGRDYAADSEGRALLPSEYYHLRTDTGWTAAPRAATDAIAGASLLALAAETLDTPQSLRDAKRVLRQAMDECLDGRDLKSRQVATAMRRNRTHAPQVKETP
jgi:DNA repair protein RecO (recombination protein O)